MTKRILKSWGRRLLADRRGIAAIEFALLTPVLGLILAGAVDFGGVLYNRFRLDAAVAAGANYAQVNAANVNSTSAAVLASNMATVVETSQGSGWADDNVVVNNGPNSSAASGTMSSGGTAANADACYCPTGTASNFTWGAAATCGAPCASGVLAGKFVVIKASRYYTPIFSSYGLVKNNTISVSAVVQTQ